LLGANIYDRRPGVVLEVTCDATIADARYDAWTKQVAAFAHALGWGDTDVRVRRDSHGASLFIVAPVDVLMTATEVNEQAWVAAESGDDVDEHTINRLRSAADAERSTRPNFAEIYAGGIARGISTNFDDDSICLGSGIGARTYPFAELPPLSDIPRRTIHDIPIALVTGSNGKTTTTRLVAAMCRARGRVTGWCCSDGVWVDDEQLESGDYSGPAGAREVLRDSRVEAAVLETARGGILRRGLAMTRASAAIITNISADHFGEYGIESLSELAEVKGVVADVLTDEDARLILNADDPQLVALARNITVPVSWFSMDSENTHVDLSAAAYEVAEVIDGRIIFRSNGVSHDIGVVAEMPLTLAGTAKHNIANLLGACLLGVAMGVPIDDIRDTAMTFGSSPADNPGRLQLWRFGGVTVLTDYAHNPDGLAALVTTAKGLPATRRLLILGQAGNRDDESLRALPKAALEISHFDRVIIKEMAAMLRGRAPGEVPRILGEALIELGVSPDQIEVAPSEIAAVRHALAWARDGDLLVCPVHVSKAEVSALLRKLQDSGWEPDATLPA
jgi:cyanophycin synthetase